MLKFSAQVNSDGTDGLQAGLRPYVYGEVTKEDEEGVVGLVEKMQGHCGER